MKKTILTTFAALVCAALMVSCGSKNTTITKGNEAEMDSLSYCLGANIGGSIKVQMSDIPFDIAVLKDGIKGGLTEKAKYSQEESVEVLREFFSIKLQERQAAIKAQKADSTSTEAPIQIFETIEECESVSYALGNDIGTNVRGGNFPIQYYWLLKGFQDAWEESTEIAQGDIMTTPQGQRSPMPRRRLSRLSTLLPPMRLWVRSSTFTIPGTRFPTFSRTSKSTVRLLRSTA